MTDLAFGSGFTDGAAWTTPTAKVVRRDARRLRILILIGAFGLVYGLICARLLVLGLTDPAAAAYRGGAGDAIAAARPDLTDRNGEVLATDIKTASLFAEPRRILDVDEAAELVAGVLPGLDAGELRRKLSGKAGFVWLKREITPEQQEAIHRLGLPGIGFVTENRRFYPGGPTSSHILGAVNVDNQGIAGIEKYFDDHWLADLHSAGFANKENLAPVKLSIDLRVQHILRDELAGAIERYNAIAATGIILDVRTGEVVAMSSLPDYNPNNPAQALEPDRLNRMTAGVFELGSVFKTFTLAMGLDAGTVTMNSVIDASHGLKAGGHIIEDFHGKHRPLTLPEIFIYSSNIGAAKVALTVGPQAHEAFLRRIGMLSKIKTELPETALPLWPSKWTDVSTMTIAFGHGLSVTPLHAAVAAAALMNGGKLIPPTFLTRDAATADALAVQVVKPETSDKMRALFRMNVEKGSGTRAEVPGYVVGGKTGTAEKVVAGRYIGNKRLNSFLAAFPMDNPRYVVLVTLDEPQSEKPGMSATASLNAAPTIAAVIRRAAPMLGVPPRTIGVGGALLASY